MAIFLSYALCKPFPTSNPWLRVSFDGLICISYLFDLHLLVSFRFEGSSKPYLQHLEFQHPAWSRHFNLIAGFLGEIALFARFLNLQLNLGPPRFEFHQRVLQLIPPFLRHRHRGAHIWIPIGSYLFNNASSRFSPLSINSMLVA